ncbi:hypothetical protein HanIR_Chr13g0664941 [Helianthus annuus]|nr:hypothetical protein HanIR_Chr13g0664941 [Helianthus annuus]
MSISISKLELRFSTGFRLLVGWTVNNKELSRYSELGFNILPGLASENVEQGNPLHELIAEFHFLLSSYTSPEIAGFLQTYVSPRTQGPQRSWSWPVHG